MLKSHLEEFLKKYTEEIRESAEMLLNEEMPLLTEELFALYEQTGNRLRYETVYFTRRKFLAVLGLKAVMLANQKQPGAKSSKTAGTNAADEMRKTVGTNAADEMRKTAGTNAAGEMRKTARTNAADEMRKTVGTNAAGEAGMSAGTIDAADAATASEMGESSRTVQGEKAYFEKLEKVLCGICEEECWALPAHVDRSSNAEWRITVDLFAAETAQTLAELVDRAGRYLSRETCDRVIRHVERRVLFPFFSSREPYSRWERAEDNWNAVCSGAIGSACIHLAKRNPERFGNLLLEISQKWEKILREPGVPVLTLQDCLDRICKALAYYVDGFSEDGACMEGLGYYFYGMTYFVNFARELYEYTGGKKDLFCGEWGGLKKLTGNGPQEKSKEGTLADKRFQMALFPVKCFWKDGGSICFSDGSPHESFHVGICSVLALHYGKMAASGTEAFFPDFAGAAGLHTDPCYRFAVLKMDLFYTEVLYRELETVPDLKINMSGAAEPESYFLPAAQWYIANARTKAGFACKGGHNGEPHNHNDIGHFIYKADGTFFFTDLGAGEYTREYFGKGRYDILCNNSFGHSVPIVNGQGQGTGKAFRCDSFSMAPGSWKETEILAMELHSAYRKELLDRFHRKFSFCKKTGTLTVQDKFEFRRKEESTMEIVENLVTQVFPEISGSRVFLRAENSVCVLEVWQEQEEPLIWVKEYVHSNHQGFPEKVYAIQWKVPCMEESAAAKWRIRMA